MLVEASGKLDIYNANDYLDEIKSKLNYTKELILDFSKIDYITSIGLRVILELYKTMCKNEGTMKIKNVTEEVLKVFKIAGFDNLLNIQNDDE